MSSVRVVSPDGRLVDDTESELSFTLPEDAYVLVIYNASNKYNIMEYYYWGGKYCYVNVDGMDVLDSMCGQSIHLSFLSDSITCTWAGRLKAGSHVVKGRFGSTESGRAVMVDVRQVIVLAVPVSSGLPAYGMSAPPVMGSTVGSPTEDPYARLLVNLGVEASGLVIYNACKTAGSTAPTGGYSIVYLNGMPVPESMSEQQSYYTGNAMKFTSVAFVRLGMGVNSITGRFADTSITTRTLAYIISPREWASAGRMSSARVEGNYSTMGSPPWDDPEAVVAIDLPEDSVCLAVYSVSNSRGSTESFPGKFTLINVDGVDVPESFSAQSLADYNHANSVLSLWAGRLTAGSHTIKGRWGSNEPDQTTGIDRRVIAVICIPESLLI
jgi:hypothetical protein